MDYSSIPKSNMHPAIKLTKDFGRCPLWGLIYNSILRETTYH